MPSVKIGADTNDTLIDYWLTIYRDTTRSVAVRAEAAARLDELLRAPAWPT